jgi:hypothetical protein
MASQSLTITTGADPSQPEQEDNGSIPETGLSPVTSPATPLVALGGTPVDVALASLSSSADPIQVACKIRLEQLERLAYAIAARVLVDTCEPGHTHPDYQNLLRNFHAGSRFTLRHFDRLFPNAKISHPANKKKGAAAVRHFINMWLEPNKIFKGFNVEFGETKGDNSSWLTIKDSLETATTYCYLLCQGWLIKNPMIGEPDLQFVLQFETSFRGDFSGPPFFGDILRALSENAMPSIVGVTVSAFQCSRGADIFAPEFDQSLEVSAHRYPTHESSVNHILVWRMRTWCCPRNLLHGTPRRRCGMLIAIRLAHPTSSWHMSPILVFLYDTRLDRSGFISPDIPAFELGF